MLLAVDIGNTNTVLGLFQGDRLICRLRITSDPSKNINRYAKEISGIKKDKRTAYEAAIVSSVVPALDNLIEKAVKKVFNCRVIFVKWQLIKGLKITLSGKGSIGIDRLVNAWAAYRLYGGGAVIIDFGTATTFCALDREGRYMGGAITSGLAISRDVLHERTAKLPMIEIKKPKNTIGKDTVSAMQSGLYFGYIDLVEGMIKRFKKEIGGRVKVIATGGLAGVISKGTGMIDVVDPDLTLKGLKLIYNEMRDARSETRGVK